MAELYRFLLDLTRIVVATIYIYFPAMAANGAPVFIARGTPMDLGRKLFDGRRILGDGKTFEGFFIGVLFGTSVGAIYAVHTDNPWFMPYALILSIGALLGDVMSAFIKRRIGLQRGEPAPVLDQTSFLVIATIAVKFSGIEYLVGVEITVIHYITGVALSIILHIATNYGAYRLGLKSVPW